MKHVSRLASALALAALFLGCASPPPASAPPDWSLVAYEETPRIVTVDPDGRERVTPLWLVVVDGEGYLRTSETRWYANLRREPALVLRIGGEAHEMRAEFVDDPATRARLSAAFRAKYSLADRLLGWFGDPASENFVRLVNL